MKILFLALALLPFATAYGATAPNASEEACDKKSTYAKIQRAVKKELRAKLQSDEPAALGYNFGFSNVSHGESRSDLTVYLEQTRDPFKPRTAYIAQYSVNKKNCSPEFKTLHILESEASEPAPLSAGADRCNDPAYLPGIKAEVKENLKWLYDQIMPGSTIDNFSFAKIQRTPGTGDLVAFFEARRPGNFTRPNITQFSIDPVTCKATYEMSSGFIVTPNN